MLPDLGDSSSPHGNDRGTGFLSESPSKFTLSFIGCLDAPGVRSGASTLRGILLLDRRSLSLVATIAMIALTSPLQHVSAASGGAGSSSSDTRSSGSDYNNGRPLPLSHAQSKGLSVTARRAQPASVSGRKIARIGQEKIWLAIDDAKGTVYPKVYRLRGRTKHMEVWVAAGPSRINRKTTVKGTHFLPGDCRNDERIKITDAEVHYFMKQFETNIYPTESQAFSVPPPRDGSKQLMTQFFPELSIPQNYYKGGRKKIITLVDNVRDSNFYDLNDSQEHTYIAGFFYSVFNQVFDHNVMTIDAYDWIHRTRANPPNEPVPGDPCASKPARPYLYEGVFAHEYQHLLESYRDDDEVNWVNEGLSDHAATITGYFDPAASINDQNFQSHIQCFLGWNEVLTPANPNPGKGGPENSLTYWGDQGDDQEILCDYGAAHSFMEMLSGRYGPTFMKKLHRSPRNGLNGLNHLLDTYDPTKNAQDLIHEWAAMVSLDGVLDDGATLNGGTAADYQTPTLDATINWDNDDDYSTPGAPPNGSDYVRLRKAGTDPVQYLPASAIHSISFQGDKTLPPLPLEWSVDSTPPGRSHAGDSSLYSGSGANFDRAMIKQIPVPAGSPTLTFDTRYNMEKNYDFGFVQVSTDGGKTFTSLSNADTTSDIASDSPILGTLSHNAPGLNGKSGSGTFAKWVPESFDLSAYAGQNVLLSFRYITDSGVDKPGWWVDNIKVDGTVVSDGTSLGGWRSLTDVNPTPVAGFKVQLVAYTDDHAQAWIYDLPLDANFSGSIKAAQVPAAIGSTAQTVAAIVTYDEPTERDRLGTRYAPYTLKVGNNVQPGGR